LRLGVVLAAGSVAPGNRFDAVGGDAGDASDGGTDRRSFRRRWPAPAAGGFGDRVPSSRRRAMIAR
jgi:hypothetical protein